MRRVDRVSEYFRSSVWVAPAAGAILAVVFGRGAVAIDHATHAQLGFSGGVAGARSVPSTIAAAMITFTGLVFSITIVALQLASGQFSPRVMRTFLRDRTGQIALATFVATFSFAFTVLRSTKADDVPGLSVTFSIVLVFASMGVFIHYINHTAHAIRAAAIIESVARETRECIDRNYPVDRGTGSGASPPVAGEGTVVLNEDAPGVVLGFDIDRIVERAAAAGGVVAIEPAVGDFVPHGATLLTLYGMTPGDCDVRSFIALGRERTMQQDPAFGIRQLVDLATKALSPGINDPTTAVQALDQLHDLLRRLATRPLPPGRAVDDKGVVRLSFPSPTWDDSSRSPWTDQDVRRGQPPDPPPRAQRDRGLARRHDRGASGGAAGAAAAPGGSCRACVPRRARPGRLHAGRPAGPRLLDPEATEPTPLPDDASVGDGEQVRDRVGRNLPLLRGEVLNQLRPTGVVIQDVVIVDELLDEQLLADQQVDGRTRTVGPAEEPLAVDLAHDAAVDLDHRLRPDHLQVEDDPAGDERLSHST